MRRAVRESLPRSRNFRWLNACAELQELLAQRQCTVPVLLDSSTSKDSAVLVMEYLHPSEWQPLNEWWTAWEASDSSTAPCTPFSKVGQLHGVLHGSVTVHMSREPSPELSPSCFANRNIQEVRSVTQFSGAQAALAGTVQELPPGPRSALEAALATACAFGAAFAGGAEGVCFTHGDAWLPSYMVRAETHKGTDASLAAIDWEFCHWGWPVQDVAHTFAHIWMHAHVWAAEGPRETSKAGRTPHHEAGSPSPVLAADSQPLLSTACPGAAAWQAYRQGYVAELSGKKAATSPLPFAPTVAGAAADQAASAVLLWAGTEVLARATGPFGFGFLYNPHASTSVSPLAADATHVAACMLLVAHWGGAAVELEEFPQHWHAGLRYASDLHEALGEQLATQDRP